MTVVYIDSLFLLNLVVNYLLLLAAARLAGEVICRPRLGLGAGLGALYAALVFFPGMGFLLHPLCKLGAAVIMLLCAFGGSRRLLRLTLVFFGVSAAFGGGIFAIELLGGRGLSLKNGIFYSSMDLRLILLSAAACYVVISLIFSRTGRHTGPSRELMPAVLTLGGKKVALTALVDTGNTLTDPVTNRPVMVAEGEKLVRLFPDGEAPAMEDLRDPVAGLERLSNGNSRGRYRLLPYQAVGVECGLLLALRLDGAKVGETDYGGILVALSPNRLSDGGGYSALIGA
ncbi:Sigma-E processing peptidase SpoIIGA [uncultured Eubacteriales bacterium]|uniref:Sporulation sigma-E factor-processing peptidase n=1 Tax=uncultured Eubacteriales bacterium TaxID=172733 RepID=A0A212K040_9FIRM|nr:Sigma-E processing peptidase SpoIIGA [uncultured Eubacteriales bacterium]